MSSRLRSVCIAGLLVGCASVIAAGCSSDSAKKVTHTPVGGDAGEAGESAGGASAGTGGAAGATPTGEAGASEAGQGGAPVIGAAGAPAGGAPDTSSAGAAGEPVVGEAGAGGAGAQVCTPSGQTYGVDINVENQQTVCRGALVLTNVTASDADQTFTCCGVSDTTTPYSVELTGVQSGTSAVLSFVVPVDAPVGAQSISATCTSGAATNAINVTVLETLAPAVTQVETSLLFSGDTVLIDGSNFDPATDRVFAISVGGVNSNSECFINQGSSSSTLLSCGFDGISVGDYYLSVQRNGCGSATTLPTITIQPAT